MKTTLTTLLVLATISFGTIVKADEIALPVITKPAILEEGTQRELTKDQIAELLPWAKDSKLFLLDLLENIQGLTTTDKVERLVEGIANTVGESAPKNSELLMRYALNRGLVLNDILSREMSADSVGTADAKLRVLVSSINMAIKYYDIDMAVLAKKSVAPYVIFGLDYFEFLNELNKSVFDASAQYSIQRTALEWLQWDLYRDLNNASYAPQIVKINNSLKTFPNRKITDAQAIANIRLMKKTAQQLNVKDTLARLEQERKLSQAKTEEERRMMLAKTEQDRQRVQRELELERLRGNRSAIDIEKVKTYSATLYSNAWDARRSAANQLAGMVGADVTMTLLNRYLVESDSDVNNALYAGLSARMNQAAYVMKIESLDELTNQILSTLSRSGRVNDWSKRRNIVYLLTKITTVESYKLLGSWLQVESDSDVKNAIVSGMATIEKNVR